MKQMNVGVIGTGWCGGIRAVACAKSALVGELHIAETNPERLAEMTAMTNPTSASDTWEDIIANPDIEIVMISATPETLHYPMTKAALEAGKHVLLEKPMAISLSEADELIELSESKGLKFTIGYSQRFNNKQSLIKRSVADGSVGEPVSVLVSRHISRNLGAKIGNRIKLSPAAMEATHDIDFAFWCLEPRRPVRVYSQVANGIREEALGLPDAQMIMITMDDGVMVTIGAGMNLPPGYKNAATTWIEFIGQDGSVFVDDTSRDIMVQTVDRGVEFPLSSMPGEFVGEMYAGPMERETTHFIEAVMFDREVMVKPRDARLVMEVYMAADLSVELNQVVELPLSEDQVGLALAASVKS